MVFYMPGATHEFVLQALDPDGSSPRTRRSMEAATGR